MKDYIRLGEEVFYTNAERPVLDASDMEFILDIAQGTERKRARICTHRSIESKLHNMLIAHSENAYVRPHKHVGKVEAGVIVQGSVDLVIYNCDGHINDVVSLSAPDAGGAFYFKLPPDVYHTLCITSPWLVFLEITTGPFISEETVFPNWAPACDDAVQEMELRNYIREQKEKWINQHLSDSQ